jgi:hypothetical protein
MTRYHHSTHRSNPLTLVLLVIPVLMILGAIKSCEVVHDLALEVAPPAVHQSAEPPRYRIEKEQGWRI